MEAELERGSLRPVGRGSRRRAARSSRTRGCIRSRRTPTCGGRSRDWIGVPPENVVSAHGIQALVGMVAAAFVSRGTTVVIPAPTYGLYAQVCAAAGAEVVRRARRRRPAHRPRGHGRGRRREHGARLVWIADPNNPTGSVVTEAEWRSFLDALPPAASPSSTRPIAEYVDPAVRVVREPDVLAGRPVLLAAHVLEDLRPRRSPARLRGRGRSARLLLRRRAGAVQREPRGARRRAARACATRRSSRSGAASPRTPARFSPAASSKQEPSRIRPRRTSCSSGWGATTSGWPTRSPAVDS